MIRAVALFLLVVVAGCQWINEDWAQPYVRPILMPPFHLFRAIAESDRTFSCPGGVCGYYGPLHDKHDEHDDHVYHHGVADNCIFCTQQKYYVEPHPYHADDVKAPLMP